MALRRAASVLLRTLLRVPVTSPARKALLNPLQAPPCRHFSPRPPPPVPFAAAAAVAVADAAEEAFEAARSTNDMLAAFSRLEATVLANDKRLALACLKLGLPQNCGLVQAAPASPRRRPPATPPHASAAASASAPASRTVYSNETERRKETVELFPQSAGFGVRDAAAAPRLLCCAKWRKQRKTCLTSYTAR